LKWQKYWQKRYSGKREKASSKNKIAPKKEVQRGRIEVLSD
jgi:hypothetical protein